MTIDLDAKVQNADWTKVKPDLGVTNAAELRAELARQGMSVEHFKTLPVYRFSREHFDKLLKEPT